MKYSYTLENLNCAHCAQKIETKIAETDGFEGVSFNFATKKLNFESEKKNPLSEIQQICDDIEDGVTVKDNNEKSGDDNPSKVEKILLIIGIILGIAALITDLFFKTPLTFNA